MQRAADTEHKEFLDGNAEAVDRVDKWTAQVLAWPRFRFLRDQRIDLHQEILRRVVESLRRDRYDPTRDFRTYVQGVARHTASEVMRKRIRDRKLEQTLPERPEPFPSPAIQLARREAWEILDRLPVECRGLLESYYIEQHSLRDIADRNGIPIGTVKSRLFRCLESARRSLRSRRGKDRKESLR